MLQWPAGRELVAAVGVLFIGIAIYQAYLGLSKKFLEYSKTGQMSQRVLKAFTTIGVVGLVARAVAFALIGIFVLKAASDYSPKDAVGIDGALARLLQHSYGTTRADRRRGRADRVRRVLLRRRALPQDLTHRTHRTHRHRSPAAYQGV